MDLRSFLSSLRMMDSGQIVAASADLDEQVASAAGQMEWWRATVEIDRELRARRSARLGASAAHDAAVAVTEAARAAGIGLPDPRVTAVARAAGDVARGLVVHAAATDDLLRGCRHLSAA